MVHILNKLVNIISAQTEGPLIKNLPNKVAFKATKYTKKPNKNILKHIHNFADETAIK